MESLDIQFSNFELLGILFLAIILFIAIKLAEKLIPFLIKDYEKKRGFKRYFAIIEIFIWIAFTIFAIQKLSDSNQLYSFGLFALLMVVGFWILWFYLRNYISGGVFKINRKFEINDTVQVDEYQGKIKALGNHRLELESESGEIIYIPYSQLSNAVIIKLHPGEKVLSHSFTISTLHEKKPAEIQEDIKYEILSLPWSSIKKEPHVKLIHEDKTHLVYEVIVYTLEKEYLFQMEQKVRSKFDVAAED